MSKITVSISREDLKNNIFKNCSIVSKDSTAKVDIQEMIVELLKNYYK